MQMKMFLTRLGVNSKAIVTGDITQIDLVDPAKSGLVAVSEILGDVEGIKFVWFGEEDVVRHRLVKRIIKAFSRIRPNGDGGPEGSGGPEDSDE
jgi:phosphate starvation-inducible PhoH-like protein